MTKISVIMVSLNSAQTIAAAIESFHAQTYADKELLIIDGLSTDDTLDIVRKHSLNSVRVVSGKDRGIYDAMNKGLELYSGDAVGFLNSDDTFHDEDSLSRLAYALEDSDIAYGDLNMVDSQTEKNVRRVWKAGPFVPGSFRKGWMPPHPTFYMRRSVAADVGQFRNDFRISADYDFMLRAMELHSPRVRYIQHTLINFALGGRSTSGIRAVIDGNLECLQSRQEHLGAPLMDLAFFLKPARKIFQLRRPCQAKR